jgi:DNA-binding transcriptional MerR regulator
MKKKKFSTFDIVKLLQISRSNLQQWIDRGFVLPSLEKAEGKGTRNKFSREDLYRIRLFQKLHEAGLSQREASENAKDIDFGDIVSSFDWALIMPLGAGAKSIIICDEDQLIEQMRKWSKVLFIAIHVGMIMFEVDEKLEE